MISWVESMTKEGMSLETEVRESVGSRISKMVVSQKVGEK